MIMFQGVENTGNVVVLQTRLPTAKDRVWQKTPGSFAGAL